MSEDQNPDRLCSPEYHESSTIREYLKALRAFENTEATINKLHEQRDKDLELLEKRQLEIREWMRRGKKDKAAYELPDDYVLIVDTYVSHDFASFTVMRVEPGA